MEENLKGSELMKDSKKNTAADLITISQHEEDERIKALKDELKVNYAHLNPRFYPNSICMQAKIPIRINPSESLLKDPGIFADILKTENFVEEGISCVKTGFRQQAKQYVLVNEEIAHIGHRFVLKAIFGPTFLSLWFRNESSCDRLEVPLCYAFEIMNKLHDRLNRVSTKQFTEKATNLVRLNNLGQKVS